jgi:hypothetical protein
MGARKIDLLWAVLLAATALTWTLGEQGLTAAARSAWAVPLVFALAAFKGALIALDFMETRKAPPLWRRLLLGWLCLVTGLILLAWWLTG